MDHCEVQLSSRRSTDGGLTWRPIVHHVLGTLGTVVFDKITSAIIVQYCTGSPHCHQNPATYQIISYDDGITYSSPTLVDEFLQPFLGVRPCCGQALQLSSGRIVFCAVHGTAPDSNVIVYFSDDGGKTYETSMDAGSRFSKMGECTMAELQNGSIYLNMRPHEDLEKCDCRAYSLSDDGGHTWSGPFFDHHLIHGPGCEASVLAGNGSVVYFANPFTENDSRNNMTVQMSIDGATTWTRQLQLNSNPAAYSSLSTLQDENYIGLLYETSAAGCDGPACAIVFAKVPRKF
jgi:sialidase-1